jgi:CDP-diacylglycerol--glycerol-3-phosphate 3-phosphatidyltransferase
MVPLNVPNVLTVLRILLVPVLVVALLGKTDNGDLLAAVVFAAASFTDLLDGYLARTRGSVTNFGKLMDPVADKLLIIAALISLVSLGRLAAWVAMVIIARELAVTVMRAAATQQGVILAASALGKLKTLVQVATVASGARLPHRGDHRRLRRGLHVRPAPSSRRRGARARPARLRLASTPRRRARRAGRRGARRPRRWRAPA